MYGKAVHSEVISDHLEYVKKRHEDSIIALSDEIADLRKKL